MSLCLTSHQQLRSYGDESRQRVSSDRLEEPGIELRTSGYKVSGLFTTTGQLLPLALTVDHNHLCVELFRTNGFSSLAINVCTYSISGSVNGSASCTRSVKVRVTKSGTSVDWFPV